MSIYDIITTVAPAGLSDWQIELHVKQTQARETIFFQQALVNILLV
jgi:hypothetical protein